MFVLEIHDALGVSGVFLIVGAYLLLQLEKIDPRHVTYSLANAAGAGLVLVSLTFEFNISAFLVEAFWFLISFIGIAKWVTTRRAEPDS